LFFVNIDIEKCTGCGDCIYICVVRAFRLSSEGKIDPYQAGECVGCMGCVEVCPEQCIEVIEI
jgi:NAD-dependent dihydropyrimidine dehydrogenase PreA subunit